MNTHFARLTSPALWAHHAPATEKDVAGGGSPNGAAMSRNVYALRLFYRLVRPAMGGRTEGAARLADAPSVFQPPFGLPTRLEAGWRFIT